MLYDKDLVCKLQSDEKIGFNLNEEMAPVHDRKKPVNCSFCSATFTRNSSLNRHVASVHEGKKPKDGKKLP